MQSDKCPSCRVSLPAENGFVFCSNCKLPEFHGNLLSPFEVFRIPRAFKLDEKELETLYFSLSKKIHPDRFTASGNQARLKSQQLSAALNQSYLALKEPEARLETLLKMSGRLEASTKGPQKIPTELTEEFFEIQEATMEDPDRAKPLMGDFNAKLSSRMDKLTQQMFTAAEAIDWTREAGKEVEEILLLRAERAYVRSMLDNLEALSRKLG